MAKRSGSPPRPAPPTCSRSGSPTRAGPTCRRFRSAALRAGQVDAIAMFPGLSLQLVATGEARSLMDLGKEMEPTLPDVIVASQEMMDKRPQAVRGTLAAIYKTVSHLRNNRDWALKY